MKKTIILAIAVTAIATALVIPSLGHAGKPTKTSIDASDGVYAGSTNAVVSSTGDGSAATTTEHWVRAQCWQDQTLVYAQYVKTTGGVATFQLGPTSLWTGGSADCEAEVGFWRNGRWVASATDAFHVSG